MSLASAATLVLAMNLSSSVVQPLFGYLSDRRSLAWVLPAALVLGGIGTACIGFAPSLPLMFLGALVAGVGVAAFHPEGSRFANYFGGSRRATSMGWFTLGGYLGFAAGPIFVTPLLLIFGLHGTAFLLVPAVVLALLMLLDLPRFESVRTRAHGSRLARGGADDWRGFAALSVVVALRSATFLAAVTFMPLFAIAQAHLSKTSVGGSIALSALLIAGAFGTIVGGRVADRFGRRSAITVSLGLTACAAAAFVAVGTFAPFFSLIVTVGIVFGFALGLSSSVVVVLGQEYLPQRIGTASGVTLGLAVTIGGLLAPVFGAIGDRYGLVAVFGSICIFAIAGFISCALLRPAQAIELSTVESSI